MSKQIKREYPFVTPDTMRQKLQLDQRFFDAHTKQIVGYEHMNGTQYVGHIQNWGSELLLETKKLKLNHPPLGDLHLHDTFHEYFTLQYDDNLDTYLQENAVMCLLRKNVLQNGITYLIFKDVTKMMLPRAEASSESNVYPHLVYRTTTPPILHVEMTNRQGQLEQKEYPLIADDDCGEVTYWFQNTSSTRSGSNDYDTSDVETLDTVIGKMLLDTEHCSDTQIQTIPLQVWMEELPLVWLTCSRHTTLPDIDLWGNIDQNGNPLLNPGSDGHGHHFLYPFAYGSNNLPTMCFPSTSNPKWQIRVYATHNAFLENDNSGQNLEKEIRKIQFVSYKEDDPFSSVNHGDCFTVDCHIDHVKLKFVNDASKYSFQHWSFHQPKEGEWDYDGLMYQNEVYGYINDFNMDKTDPDYLVPVLQIIPNQSLVTHFDWEKNHVVMGIHMDNGSEYSAHHVTKKNGTIFNLGDFDGLPDYYYHKLPRNIRRPHIELYGIRDCIKQPTQHAMDKQVAALLIDSAIPQTKSNDTINEMKSSIRYDIDRQYVTEYDHVLSPTNALSDIGFVSREQFTDVNYKDNTTTQLFIYRGNRTFSLYSTDFDPFLETGRIYYLSNDATGYENNATATNPKPPLTVARICDIPTRMEQLIGIKYKAPPVLADEKYVRQEACYTKRDQTKLLRITNDGVRVHDSRNCYVFTYSDNLDTCLPYEYICEHYGYDPHQNQTLKMKPGIHTALIAGYDYQWSVVENGTSHLSGEAIQVTLAGTLFRGIIHSTSNLGKIHEIRIEDINESDLQISMSNFDDQEAIVEAVVISKGDTASEGDGCLLKFRINDGVWEAYRQATPVLQPLPNLYTYKLDEFGNVWIWEYTNQNEQYQWLPVYQLTGDEIVDNGYDIYHTKYQRDIQSVYMKAITQCRLSLYGYDDVMRMNGIAYDHQSRVSRIDTDTDIPIALQMQRLVAQDTLYVVIPEENTTNQCYIDTYEMNPVHVDARTEPVQYPRNHKATCNFGYHKATNLLLNGMLNGWSSVNGYIAQQPNVFMYNPFATTFDTYEIVCNDVVQRESVVDIGFHQFPSYLYTRRGNQYFLRYDVYQYTGNEIRLSNDEKCCYHPNINDKPAIALLRSAGEVIASIDENGIIHAIGKQPTGAVRSISTEQYATNYHTQNGQSVVTKLLYFFHIPDTSRCVPPFTGFHMKDEYSYADISEYTVLLYKNILYCFDKTKDEWLPVTR